MNIHLQEKYFWTSIPHQFHKCEQINKTQQEEEIVELEEALKKIIIQEIKVSIAHSKENRRGINRFKTNCCEDVS